MYSKENNHLGAKIDDLEDEIRKLNNELKAAKEEIKHYRQETQNKQGTINRLEQEIYTLEKGKSSNRQSFETQNIELELPDNYNSDKRKEYDKDEKSNKRLEYYENQYLNSERFHDKYRPELIRLVLEKNLRIDIDKDTFSAFYQANGWLETLSFCEDGIEKTIVGEYKSFCKE